MSSVLLYGVKARLVRRRIDDNARPKKFLRKLRANRERHG
jgi:hypothetical protein